MSTEPPDRNRPDPSAMIHLYRGELGRMTAYRVRLDTTTNWALGASVAVVTFTLGNAETPHVVMLLPLVLSIVFALLEGRRMQDLEMIRMRVRWLERGFFAERFGTEPMEGWAAALAESLARPTSPIGLLDALAVRVRRNYVWLTLTLYGAWLFKLSLGPQPVLEAAAIGPLPGAAVLVLATVSLLPWMILTWRAKPLLPG